MDIASTRRLAAIPTVLVLVLACIVGCAGGGGDAAVPEAAAPTPSEIETARAVYENESCGMCHGPGGDGSDLAPALVDLDGFWDEDRLVRYLENPAAFIEANPAFDDRRDTVFEMEMPAYDHVTEDDRRALARWLLSR